ncbi:MAG TPA: hypothetical protein PLQ19_09795 [Aeromicrobium sp.]|nr:hypothetical protein [Aeromicrobium sp.]
METAPSPKNLTPTQARGLDRLGDILIPGDEDLPSFSQANLTGDMSRMLPYMNEADRSSLLLLMTACAFLPTFAIRALVALAAGWRRAPEPVAGVLRMANIGIKGVVHSLYWSDLHHGGIHPAIGYNATINEAAYEASLKTANQQEEK